MSHTSLLLTSLMMMALVIYLAPGVVALNRGHILRNVALWLAIFLGLALVYKYVGPDSPHPLFNLPEAMQGMKANRPTLTPPPAASDDAGKTENKDAPENGDMGYTPPKE